MVPVVVMQSLPPQVWCLRTSARHRDTEINVGLVAKISAGELCDLIGPEAGNADVPKLGQWKLRKSLTLT